MAEVVVGLVTLKGMAVGILRMVRCGLLMRKKGRRQDGRSKVGFILVVCRLERCWDASRYLWWWSLRHHFDGLGCSS